ncbi:MAG TPA: hypothetical protein VFO45_09790 [Sphingomicrobium sp.]|nr:hypothetical protein [Sphingomicrobium sp.]
MLYIGNVARFRADTVEQLCTRDERHAEAGGRQEQPAIAGIVLKIMDTALDRADGNGIGDQERFQACLDDEQATDFLEAIHWLRKRHANGAVPPFPD